MIIACALTDPARKVNAAFRLARVGWPQAATRARPFADVRFLATRAFVNENALAFMLQVRKEGWRG
jgi:hypothetical protein